MRSTTLMAASVAAIAAVATISPALAGSHGTKVNGIEISQVWARATAATAKNGAAYFTMQNHNMGADRLISASAAVAKKTELHTHLNEGGVMKMRPVDAVDVPGHGMAMLKPGGDHVMLMGLASPLKVGSSFPLTLIFEKAGTATVKVMVMKMGPKGDDKHGQKMEHKHDMKKQD